MSAYSDIQNPQDKQEVRDLALMAAQVVRWAGYTNLDFDEALPVAWESFEKAAAFMLNPTPTREGEDGKA